MAPLPDGRALALILSLTLAPPLDTDQPFDPFQTPSSICLCLPTLPSF